VAGRRPAGQRAFRRQDEAPETQFKAVGGSSIMLWMALGERLELAIEPIWQRAEAGVPRGFEGEFRAQDSFEE
jgi:hypothetical protein